MAQLYSFHNEARDIYRQARKVTETLIKGGKLKPEMAESHFRDRVAQQLTKLGMPPPKSWK